MVSLATEIFVLAKYGMLDELKILTSANNVSAEVNTAMNHGITALMAASIGGHRETVALLLDRGADVNQSTTTGRSALMFASQKGHRETVALLLDKGADVNQSSTTGETALMAASQGGHRATVEFLLDKGANVDQADILYATSRAGHDDIVDYLLNKGASWPTLCNFNTLRSEEEEEEEDGTSQRCAVDPINFECLDFSKPVFINQYDRTGEYCYTDKHDTITRDPIKRDLEFKAMDVSKIVNQLLKYHDVSIRWKSNQHKRQKT